MKKPKRKVIHPSQLPTRFPVTLTAIFFLIMWEFQAPGWVWGVIGTIFALGWLSVGLCMVEERRARVAFESQAPESTS